MKRDTAYFASMTCGQIEDELMRLDIAERFEGDVAWLARLYDGEHSFEKDAELREIIFKTNPHRHTSIFPPKLGEPPIPQPDLSDEPLPAPDEHGCFHNRREPQPDLF